MERSTHSYVEILVHVALSYPFHLRKSNAYVNSNCNIVHLIVTFFGCTFAVTAYFAFRTLRVTPHYFPDNSNSFFRETVNTLLYILLFEGFCIYVLLFIIYFLF